MNGPRGARKGCCASTYCGHTKSQQVQSISDAERCLTENQEQYSWKIIKPSVVRKPISKAILFLKTFEEAHPRNCHKIKSPVSSVSQSDYQWKSKAFEEHPPVINIPSDIEVNKSIGIDRCKSGFGKLLDPSATTNNLAYGVHSAEETSITSKNIITFWNWKNTFEKKHVVNKCYMPRREYQNPVKHVPNGGLTTEVRSNYNQPLIFSNFDSTHIKNQFINCVSVPNRAKSENTIYGSGIRIQNYLA